jgi:hypothetical protein
MEILCCRLCRLIQPPADLCRDCGRAAPEPLMEMTTSEIGGARSVERVPPASSDGDTLRLFSISVLAGAVGFALLQTPLAMALGPVAGWLSYRKRFWQTELIWQRHLTPVPAPRPPSLTHRSGVAEKHERTVAEPAALRSAPLALSSTPHPLVRQRLREPPLVVSTSILAGEEMLVRTVDAVPFWLANEGKRVLVNGAMWSHVATPPRRLDPLELLASIGLAKLPLARATRLVLHGARSVIRAGDRVTVFGELRKEQVTGVAGFGEGYRDAFTEVLQGVPGSPLWIEKQRDPIEDQ